MSLTFPQKHPLERRNRRARQEEGSPPPGTVGATEDVTDHHTPAIPGQLEINALILREAALQPYNDDCRALEEFYLSYEPESSEEESTDEQP